MNEPLNPASTGDTEQIAAWQQEKAELEQLRNRYGSAAVWLGLLSFGTMLFGFWASHDIPTLGMIVVVVGVCINMASVACDAINRGRHPAWGWIPILPFFVLQLLNDRNSRQLDLLELRLTGRWGTHSDWDRIRVFWFLVFGIAYRVWQGPREPEKLQPLPQMLRPVLPQFVPEPVRFAEGSHARIRLFPGWTEYPRSKTALIDEYDVGIEHQTLIQHLTMDEPVRKESLTGAKLLDFAKIHEDFRRQKAGQVLRATGLLSDTLRGKPAYRYELSNDTEQSLPVARLVYVWETADHFWVAEFVCIAAVLETSRAEFRKIAETIEVKHE